MPEVRCRFEFVVIISDISKGDGMENKVIVLTKDGKWLEIENCFIIGAVEYPDKVVYHKYLFTACEDATRNEMLNKAGEYLVEMKRELS
jgi:hypothetical protein